MTKNIIVTAAVALVVSLVAGFVSNKPESTLVGGLSERDVKAVTLSVGNSGQFAVTSAGKISTTGGTAGAVEISATGAGTTTLKLNSTTSGRGGCIEMKTTNGSTTKIYLAGTTTALTIAEGTCE